MSWTNHRLIFFIEYIFFNDIAKRANLHGGPKFTSPCLLFNFHQSKAEVAMELCDHHPFWACLKSPAGKEQ